MCSNCPPIGRFYYELVVGNGIGDDAVEDALEAFKRAWETRRQKAHEAASQDVERPGKDCEVAEHLVVGPFSSPQDWKNRHRSRADDRHDVVLGRVRVGALLQAQLRTAQTGAERSGESKPHSDEDAARRRRSSSLQES